MELMWAPRFDFFILFQIVGTDFLETKSSFLFTFFAKLVLSVLENAKSLDDNLISKIIPIVGNGLR